MFSGQRNVHYKDCNESYWNVLVLRKYFFSFANLLKPKFMKICSGYTSFMRTCANSKHQEDWQTVSCNHKYSICTCERRACLLLWRSDIDLSWGLRSRSLTVKHCLKGEWHHSSMDSSVPTIVRAWVPIPGASFRLFPFIVHFCTFLVVALWKGRK